MWLCGRVVRAQISVRARGPEVACGAPSHPKDTPSRSFPPPNASLLKHAYIHRIRPSILANTPNRGSREVGSRYFR